MKKLWEPIAEGWYKILDPEDWDDVQSAALYVDDYLPYCRLYKNLTPEELSALLADARKERWAALDLRMCGLKSLPEEFGDLPDLRVLAVGNSPVHPARKTQRLGEENTFTDLPESLGQLNSLITLNLYDTRLHKLPYSVGQLTSLQSLDLRHTKIHELSDGIGQLKHLRTLNLRGCHLKEIPYSVVQLGLRFEMRGSWKNSCINLTGATLDEQNITLFSQPREVIEAYYKDREKAQTLNECKVIFLGDGAAGKSSLIQRITEGTFEKDKLPTNGVNMTFWKTPVDRKNYTIRILDFGGQEIMFSMHRCFLTAHTVYVVVCESRDDVEIDAEAARWLSTVHSFAPGCPVILALNKADLNANVSVNERYLRERNPALKTVLKTSAAVEPDQRFGVNTLMQSVRDEISGAVSDYKMNADMLAVKQALENMTEDYISSEQYRKLCVAHHITDGTLQYGLLGFFRDLGVAYFYESDAFDTRLESVRVLNPEWLTNGIYRLILRTREDGFLPHQEIKDTLRRSFARDVKEKITYTPEETEFILHVMRFFQISHDMGNGVEMIPMKMPKTPPDTVDTFHKENALHLRWEGDYLPNNLIHRLMIRKFPELDRTCVWRTGGRFRQKSGGCEALAEMNDRALSVYVLGKDARVYMDGFREEILRILEELNIKPKEYVFCKSEDGREGKVLYQTLKTLYDMNVQAHFVDDLQDFINPKSVMEGSYVTPEERRTLKNSVEYCTEVRDFFISYNKANAERARWIADTLKGNGYSVYVQAADCLPGMNFPRWMAEAIQQSRGFLAVWSGTYEKAPFCKGELDAAYVREKQLEKKGGSYPVLPVRVEDIPVNNTLFAGVVRVDLLSRNEAENRAALLDAVGKLRLAPRS